MSSFSTIHVTQTHDYSSDSIPGFTNTIQFETSDVDGATAIFSSAQFGSFGISNSVTIIGDGHEDGMLINMNSAGSFSAAGWQFSNWTGHSFVELNGSSGDDTITAASVGSQIYGN